jgi:hypothetical protein
MAVIDDRAPRDRGEIKLRKRRATRRHVEAVIQAEIRRLARASEPEPSDAVGRIVSERRRRASWRATTHEAPNGRDVA